MDVVPPNRTEKGGSILYYCILLRRSSCVASNIHKELVSHDYINMHLKLQQAAARCQKRHVSLTILSCAGQS